MENFANSLPETVGLKNQLVFALSNKKPFRQFKYLVDASGIYGDQWFAFKEERLKHWVIDRSNAQFPDTEHGIS